MFRCRKPSNRGKNSDPLGIICCSVSTKKPYIFLNFSEVPLNVKIFVKQSRAPGIIPLAPITKSMWTCSVEAAMEYSRIVYDIYPGIKLVTIICICLH